MRWKVFERSRSGQSHNKSSSTHLTLLNFLNAAERDGIVNFIYSNDVLAVSLTRFRKSLVVQLIPGLCVELHNDPDTSVPDEPGTAF